MSSVLSDKTAKTDPEVPEATQAPSRQEARPPENEEAEEEGMSMYDGSDDEFTIGSRRKRKKDALPPAKKVCISILLSICISLYHDLSEDQIHHPELCQIY